MAKQLTKIHLGDIHENPYNIHEDDNEEQIRLMAESIATIGLESPLVVYENTASAGSKKSYTILSGHKRYKALKAAGKAPIFEVPCVVEEKPKNELAEREILLQNNIARKDPEEIQKQAAEASRIWSRMAEEAPDRHEQITNAFKNQFIIEETKKRGSTPDNKYIRDNFRPRLEYIKRMTGLDVSNRTVSNFLKKELQRTSEAFPQEPSKERTIKLNDIIKRMNTLAGIIEVYLADSEERPSKETVCLSGLQADIQNAVNNLTL